MDTTRCGAEHPPKKINVPQDFIFVTAFTTCFGCGVESVRGAQFHTFSGCALKGAVDAWKWNLYFEEIFARSISEFVPCTQDSKIRRLRARYFGDFAATFA